MRQRLGQHFLSDPLAIHTIVKAVENANNAFPWIEIGPGKGAITLPLIKLLNSLDMVELDDDFAQEWQIFCKTEPRARIYHSNALQIDFADIAQARKAKGFNIVGNLPYQIATSLLDKLFRSDSWQSAIVMVQKEVADRLLASSGSKQWGVLSIHAQLTSKIYPIIDLEPSSFSPAPKVQSCVLRLDNMHCFDDPCNIYSRTDIQKMLKMSQKLFSRRRKTLNSLLKLESPEMLSNIGISTKARAEDLSIAQLHELSSIIDSNES